MTQENLRQNQPSQPKYQPLVSVVIPCLNRANFLGPTIESVLQQDYPYLECIVVDGGSTDNTLEILKSYEGRIKWVSEPDGGHADAINKGWRMSAGDILAWLNADDVWAVSDAVSQVVTNFQANPNIDVLYGDCGAIDAEGNFVGMSYLRNWNLAYAVEHCDHCIPQPAAFIRRSILEQVGWLDTAFYQKKDHELWLRIGLVGNIQYIPTLLAHARTIAGLSQDGKTAAPACVQVTKKFYTLPNIPPHLKRKKRRTLSNSYLKGIDYAFEGGGDWKIIFSYALWAALMDPTNAFKVLRYFKRYVAAGANRHKFLRWLHWGLTFLTFPIRLLQLIKHEMRSPQPINLLGDRDIEWSWIAAQMPSGPGQALDFGNGGSYLPLIAAQRGFTVTAIDLEPVQWPYVYTNLRFIRGDILKTPLPAENYDLIINCSTVEHVGLAGRYSVVDSRSNGDLEAMARLWELLKPGGVMLLTIPVGQDAVFAPLCRVYGRQRLPRLLKNYVVEKEIFWTKDHQNQWILSDQEAALNFKASAGSWDPLQNIYALGCFVLKKDMR